MSKPFKIILSVFVLLLITVFLFVDVIPPRSITAENMFVTKRRIIQYARQHDHLPANLSELPPMPGYVTDTTDAWVQPIDYSFDSSGVVTLRSLGSDKKPGGVGDKRDMIGVFSSRNAQGRWEDELSDWTHDPFKP